MLNFRQKSKVICSSYYIIIILCAFMMGALTPAYSQTSVIRFGVEAWPGLTVKTEVAAELVQALGYDVKQTQMNTPFVLHGLAHDSVDVGLGLWDPVSASLMDPMVKQGKVVKLQANLKNALSGLAVPMFVHQAGVNTVADLTRYADRFDHKIYAIEAGSTFNQGVQKLIDNDTYLLGQWHVVATSVAAMLTEVGRKTKRKEWIVFYGWRPHWMNVVYNLYYLKLPENKKQGGDVVHTESTVYTFVSTDFPKKYPNLTQFFKNFQVTVETQSQWIYEYGHKRQPKAKVAKKWISSHPKIVKRFMKGVTTIDGKSGWGAVQSVF